MSKQDWIQAIVTVVFLGLVALMAFSEARRNR